MTNPLDDAISMGQVQPTKAKPAAAVAAPQKGFAYRTVPMSPGYKAAMNATYQEAGKVVANELGRVISENAVDGWEFFRVDSFETSTPKGCLGIVIGSPIVENHYVVTFRKAK